MMRPTAALACVLLCAALTLAAEAGSLGPGSRAAAAGCAWNQHAKRVVKHVRRHGRLRRLVQTRRWWSCDAVAAPVVSPPPAAPPPAGQSQPEPEANRVGVGAHDQGAFGFTLTRPAVRAGKVTVELDNQGEDPHNLNLQREGAGAEPVFQLANTLPSSQSVASFELPPGAYRLWCSLPEHDEKGMHSTLIVE